MDSKPFYIKAPSPRPGGGFFYARYRRHRAVLFWHIWALHHSRPRAYGYKGQDKRLRRPCIRPPACSLCFARCTLTNQYTAPKEAIRLRKRRYALPANEAEIVRLALRLTLDGLEEIKDNSANIKWVQARAEELLNKLQNYQWEVP